jgi:sodium pump decarboxylase gamma subunit
MELFREGIEVAVFGMAVVFTLLGSLVLAVGGMSRFANWLAPETPLPPATVASVPPAGDPELTAVVSAAIHAYRGHARREGGR